MTAKLKTAIPAGGILTQHVDQDFADFVAGRTVTQRVCIGVFQAASVSSGNQEKGRVNTTAYETLHFVEVTDEHEADRLRHLLTDIRRERGYLAKQAPLWADDSDPDEKRAEVLGYLDEWAAEQDPPLDREAVTERWVSWHGGHYNAQLDKAEPPHLREFAIVVGALADGEPAPPADLTPAADDSDDPDDDGPAGPAFSDAA